jgi:hypothetical protein
VLLVMGNSYDALFTERLSLFPYLLDLLSILLALWPQILFSFVISIGGSFSGLLRLDRHGSYELDVLASPYGLLDFDMLFLITVDRLVVESNQTPFPSGYHLRQTTHRFCLTTTTSTEEAKK